VNKQVIIAEDDQALSEILSYNLKKKGFKVRTASSGEETMLLIKEIIPDILLLDWMMPPPTGIQICRQIRQNRSINRLPIIVLTARGEQDDKIMGLEAGADDYIVKPFSTSELLARIKALLRRSSLITANESILTLGNIQINLDNHRVYRNNKAVHLGPIEYKLLKFFFENPGKVFSRDQLLDAIWGHGIFIETRTVDTHIRRLRKAMNFKGEQNFIRTVRSAGYSLEFK
tara:strand:- start:381 stop:1070 length:690 start_codon:yes stop_codon:yes gene_type:complete